MTNQSFSEITPQLVHLSELSKKSSYIDPELYTKYDVKRGLRDLNGKGVLVGITEISEVNSTKIVDGKSVPCDGELYYRGYNVQDLIAELPDDCFFGFEECTYLLLFGKLPNKQELGEFCELLSNYRSLPQNFVRDVIMKKPSKDMMNALARGVLTLYSYDEVPDDTSEANVLRQCLQLISMFPLLSVYSYQTYRHYYNGESLIIHPPKKEYSTAENILHCLRDDSMFTPLEAKLLDVALILHMEHGGGNNSTFTVRVTSSTGTDTYSAIAAGIGSLKGPLHGGANIQVTDMFHHLQENIRDWTNVDEIDTYFTRMLNKEVYNKTGLIYGIGHAVYTISDPRAILLKELARDLAREKGKEREFAFLELLEERAIEVFGRVKNNGKTVSSNVDFYSGFVYEMIGLPQEIFTPLFAMARIVGWCAHRNEELNFEGKRIIRPAYKNVLEEVAYIPIKKR